MARRRPAKVRGSRAVLHVGPRVLRTTVSIASLVAGRAITWSSVGADRQSLVFELAQTDDETAVSLEISYEEPGGVAGALLAPFVRQTVERRANTAVKNASASKCRRRSANTSRAVVSRVALQRPS